MTATLPPDAVVTRRVDAVVFDFGGVFTPSPFDAMHVLADRLDIEPAEAFDGGIDRPAALLRVGDVGRHRQRFGSQALGVFNHFVQRLPISCRHGDARPVRREPLGQRPADAGRAAGDEHHLVAEWVHRFVCRPWPLELDNGLPTADD